MSKAKEPLKAYPLTALGESDSGKYVTIIVNLLKEIAEKVYKRAVEIEILEPSYKVLTTKNDTLVSQLDEAKELKANLLLIPIIGIYKNSLPVLKVIKSYKFPFICGDEIALTEKNLAEYIKAATAEDYPVPRTNALSKNCQSHLKVMEKHFKKLLDKEENLTDYAIAKALTELGITTNRGKKYTPIQVSRDLKKLGIRDRSPLSFITLIKATK